MSMAACLRCGHLKDDAPGPCPACGLVPTVDPLAARTETAVTSQLPTPVPGLRVSEAAAPRPLNTRELPICLACPQCGARLEFARDLVGVATKCYACRQPLLVPESGRPPQEATASPDDLLAERLREREFVARPPPAILGRTERWILTLIIALMILLVAGHWITSAWERYSHAVTIYIDNGTERAVQVALDGAPAGEVPAFGMLVVQCPHGRHQIEVRTDDVQLFESNASLDRKKYLVNVGGRNQYLAVDVYATPKTDPSFLRPGVSVLRRDYQLLMDRLHHLPVGEFREIDRFDYVFEPPPPQIMKNSVKQQALLRIRPGELTVLERARRLPNPGVRDMQAVMKMMERVYQGQGDSTPLND